MRFHFVYIHFVIAVTVLSVQSNAHKSSSEVLLLSISDAHAWYENLPLFLLDVTKDMSAFRGHLNSTDQPVVLVVVGDLSGSSIWSVRDQGWAPFQALKDLALECDVIPIVSLGAHNGLDIGVDVFIDQTTNYVQSMQRLRGYYSHTCVVVSNVIWQPTFRDVASKLFCPFQDVVSKTGQVIRFVGLVAQHYQQMVPLSWAKDYVADVTPPIIAAYEQYLLAVQHDVTNLVFVVYDNMKATIELLYSLNTKLVESGTLSTTLRMPVAYCALDRKPSLIRVSEKQTSVISGGQHFSHYGIALIGGDKPYSDIKILGTPSLTWPYPVATAPAREPGGETNEDVQQSLLSPPEVGELPENEHHALLSRILEEVYFKALVPTFGSIYKLLDDSREHADTVLDTVPEIFSSTTDLHKGEEPLGIIIADALAIVGRHLIGETLEQLKAKSTKEDKHDTADSISVEQRPLIEVLQSIPANHFVGMLHSGTYRRMTPHLGGDFTRTDLHEMFPFDHLPAVLVITGELLRQMYNQIRITGERRVHRYHVYTSHYLQPTWGARMKYDLHPAGDDLPLAAQVCMLFVLLHFCCICAGLVLCYC
eukprot:TRINITY_DN64750_c0_g2_i1.p1 TRINITY_DN64750_c0_g2~~TRINITY_DN64750_c0_g2_i1.p1  ORF type:complete len:592 (-),score=-4.86 TRINITY_DN64750_c0_g2_i1:228-2003(-)